MSGVRGRNERQEGLTDWINGDGVTRKPGGRGRIDGAIRPGANVGEVSGALGVRRHVWRRRSGVGVLLAPPFLGKEEESLLFVGVVVIRNENRTTDGVAEIVFLVRCYVRGGIGAFLPGLRIEEVIAEVFEGAAVKCGGA